MQAPRLSSVAALAVFAALAAATLVLRLLLAAVRAASRHKIGLRPVLGLRGLAIHASMRHGNTTFLFSRDSRRNTGVLLIY